MSTVSSSVYASPNLAALRNEGYYFTGAYVTVYAGAGDDWIRANTQVSQILAYGGWNHDIIVTQYGNDVIFGDDQSDTVNGRDGQAGDSDTIAAGYGDDVVFGQGGSDYINGEWGNDYLNGGFGDDFINGSRGSDTIFGGAGNDTIYAAGAQPPASYWLTVSFQYNGLDDSPVNGSAMSEGGLYQHADLSTDVNYLDGGDGNDSIIAGANDTVKGGDGNDIIAGGRDIDGGNGDDQISSNFQANISGGGGNDTIGGSAGADTIVGGDGNDVIDGNTGSDNISGGSGDDVIRGGNGSDPNALSGEAGADILTGGGGSDLIWGGADGDSLFGAGGIDTLRGDAGNDYLYGGDTTIDATTDYFVYDQRGFDQDQVFNFTHEDRLVISSSIFASAAVAVSQSYVYGNSTIIDAGNGDLIVLNGFTGLQASDFFIY